MAGLPWLLQARKPWGKSHCSWSQGLMNQPPWAGKNLAIDVDSPTVVYFRLQTEIWNIFSLAHMKYAEGHLASGFASSHPNKPPRAMEAMLQVCQIKVAQGKVNSVITEKRGQRMDNGQWEKHPTWTNNYPLLSLLILWLTLYTLTLSNNTLTNTPQTLVWKRLDQRM